MTRITALAVLACSVSVGEPCPAQQAVPWPVAANKPTIGDKSPYGYDAFVHIAPDTVPVGGTFKIRCEARARGDFSNEYNGLLSEQYKLPAQIVITSTDGKIRRELLRPAGGAPAKSDARCWSQFGGRSFGREFSMKVVKLTDADSAQPRVGNIELPIGEYYVQAIYNRWLVAHWINAPNSAEVRTTDGTGDEPRPLRGLTSAQMDEPMAISEPVKLVVTASRSSATVSVPAPDCPLEIELQRPKTRLTRPVPHGFLTEIPYRITNQSDKTITVFNPGLDTRLFLIGKVADLAVLNADERYLGNYSDTETGSSRTPRKSDWVRFPPGGTVSSLCRFRPEYVPLTEFSMFGSDGLPPGKYLLELRGHEAFLTSPPAIVDQTNAIDVIRADAEYQAWRKAFPGPVICRSNRVELEIPPRIGD